MGRLRELSSKIINLKNSYIPSFYLGGETYRKVFPRKASVILYLTNRCNSKCKTCNHWSQKPKYDLDLKVIEQILTDPCVNPNGCLIEGGEALCHPEIEKVLSFFKGKKYFFLSNGLLPERLDELVTAFNIPRVAISLDGGRETYKKIRGIDGYEKVIQSIDFIKDKTRLDICFTISKYSTMADYEHVKKVCNDKNINLGINIFSDMNYFGQSKAMGQIDPYYDNFDDLYVSRFNGWIKGTVLIPCFFMRTCAVVHPNGDVVLCQKKNLKLGNLYVNSFSEIWNSKKTMERQRQHRYCTACWVSSHKTFDLEIIKNFEKVIPKRILEKIIGPYQI